jgi:lysozyme
MQKVSARGLAEIASHEGIVNSPYRDSRGIFTVGIGHTASAGWPDPAKVKRTFTVSEIMDIFAKDIAKFEARVDRAFTRKLTQAQFDAAVSFDFNTGGIHKASWVKHFNVGDMTKAKKSFMDWRKPAEIIPRRKRERDLFFSGKYSSDGFASLYPATATGKVMWSQGKRVNVLALMNAPVPPEKKPAGEHRTVPPSLPLPTPEPAPAAVSAASKGIIATVVVTILAGAGALASKWCEVIGLFCQ